MENVVKENLVKKDGLFLGSEDFHSSKMDKYYMRHKFVFDDEVISIFDNDDRELAKQISSQALKPYDKISCFGELKLSRSKENSFWRYNIVQIKKL